MADDKLLDHRTLCCARECGDGVNGVAHIFLNPADVITFFHFQQRQGKMLARNGNVFPNAFQPVYRRLNTAADPFLHLFRVGAGLDHRNAYHVQLDIR